jgi:hypothetical protein
MNKSTSLGVSSLAILMIALASAQSGVNISDRKCSNYVDGCINQGCTNIQNGICTDTTDPNSAYSVNAYKIVSYKIGSCIVELGSTCNRGVQISCATYNFNDTNGFDANRSCGDQAILRCINEDEEPHRCK